MDPGRRRVRGFCALCRSRCGCIWIVENGRLVAPEPDPTHPTGAALCAKGRAAPEHVGSPDRVLYPLKRTRPKSAALQRRLDPRVVVAQHGWWQACGELGLTKSAPIGPGTANYNAAILADNRDPVSGAQSYCSYCCDIRRSNAAMP